MDWIKRKIVDLILSEIQVGGWCGCCGAWIDHALVWMPWPYTICEECKKTD